MFSYNNQIVYFFNFNIYHFHFWLFKNNFQWRKIIAIWNHANFDRNSIAPKALNDGMTVRSKHYPNYAQWICLKQHLSNNKVQVLKKCLKMHHVFYYHGEIHCHKSYYLFFQKNWAILQLKYYSEIHKILLHNTK